MFSRNLSNGYFFRSHWRRKFHLTAFVLMIVLLIWPSTLIPGVEAGLNPFSSYNPLQLSDTTNNLLMNPMKALKPILKHTGFKPLKLMLPSKASPTGMKLLLPPSAPGTFDPFKLLSAAAPTVSASTKPLKSKSKSAAAAAAAASAPVPASYPLDSLLATAASTLASSWFNPSGAASMGALGTMPNSLLASAATKYISSVYTQYYNHLLKNPKSLLDPNLFTSAQQLYEYQTGEKPQQQDEEAEAGDANGGQDTEQDYQASGSSMLYQGPQQAKHPNMIPVHIPLVETASKYSMKYHPAAEGTYLWKKKKVKHHHYHPIVFYKKKKIPGKYWHEAQRRLVTKHGGLDVLGDIIQLPNGKVLSSNIGQNIPNFNDGYFKPWEQNVRLQNQQRELIEDMLKRIQKFLEDPPKHGLFVVKEISLLP